MISTEQLTKFGIQLDDEFSHRYSEAHSEWNESYFFDWYNHDGSQAGHCRVGWHPVQKRILFWLHIYNDNEWLIIEENRLPFSEMQLAKPEVFSYEQWGLGFRYTNHSPLQSGVLEVNGFARVASGKRQGQVLPVAVHLDFQALGPAHSRGGGTVEGHSAEGFSTDRYEQPIKATANISIDDVAVNYQARGERDHSWGPRPWDMQWQFLVLNNETFSLQATEVVIPEWPLIQIGYYNELGMEMEHIESMQFDLNFDHDNPLKPVQGGFSLQCENGRELKATLESISGSEIDITHAFNPPKRTEYRRALVKCQFENGVTSLGWLEYNRPAANKNSETEDEN
jgi:hypothetical protein